MDIDTLNSTLNSDPIELPELLNSPSVNQQNRAKIRVLISLITEIVASNSNASDYMLNKKDIEIEHIWSNHFEEHLDEFPDESEFAAIRNNIGDLLVLPKSFNASYGDAPYDIKVEQYFEQNILAQSLNGKKYQNNPDFLRFIQSSGLTFKSHPRFKRADVTERAELYKSILLRNWEK